MWLLNTGQQTAQKAKNQRNKPKKMKVSTLSLKPGSANDSSRYIIMQQVTLTDIHHHHGNSANQRWSVRNSPSVYSVRERARGAEPFLRYGEHEGKHRRERDKLNCGFHCKFVSHKHEGGMGRKRNYSGMAAIET